MDTQSLFSELRDKFADRQIRFLPVPSFDQHYIDQTATGQSSHADVCFMCESDHPAKERLTLNVLKHRPSYPWKHNQHLSHRRKVLALRAWRKRPEQVVQMSLPRAFGKLISSLSK